MTLRDDVYANLTRSQRAKYDALRGTQRKGSTASTTAHNFHQEAIERVHQARRDQGHERNSFANFRQEMPGDRVAFHEQRIAQLERERDAALSDSAAVARAFAQARTVMEQATEYLNVNAANGPLKDAKEVVL
jgi:hypothetical protein